DALRDRRRRRAHHRVRPLPRLHAAPHARERDEQRPLRSGDRAVRADSGRRSLIRPVVAGEPRGAGASEHSMAIAPGIFRQYDIRGIVGTDLTTEAADRVGRAYAAYLAERGIDGPVAIGRDNR